MINSRINIINIIIISKKYPKHPRRNLGKCIILTNLVMTLPLSWSRTFQMGSYNLNTFSKSSLEALKTLERPLARTVIFLVVQVLNLSRPKYCRILIEMSPASNKSFRTDNGMQRSIKSLSKL